MRILSVFLIGLLLAACSAPSPFFELTISNNVCIKPYQDYTYITCEPVVVSVNENLFIIPEGTETDLASIPRILWSYVSPAQSQLMAPAILHDYLYHHNCDFSRYDADLIFYKALRQNHVNLIRANIMYYGVRMGGWMNYNKGCFDYDDSIEELANSS